MSYIEIGVELSINSEIGVDWNTVVRRDGPKLFRYFSSRFDHQQSSDLVQEVLLRLVRKQKDLGFQAASDQFTAYAFGVAHFVAREAFKKNTRLKENLVGDHLAFEVTSVANAHSSSDELLEKQRQSEILRRAIANLPLATQEILSLLVERDLNLQDIAKILGMPLNTVKSHIHRAKEKLKVELHQVLEASVLTR